MIVLGLRIEAARGLVCAGLLMLGGCAREHAKEVGDPADPNAIESGEDDPNSGGTRGDMGAAGQSGSGAGASEELTGGTGASVVDAGAAAPSDAGSSISVPADADTLDPDPPVEQDAGEPHASFIGCRGPSDPGCAECKTQDGTSYYKASDGADWYNWSSVNGTCEPDCPICASCSYRSEEAAKALGERQECEPCTETGVDPCFDPTSCGCYCQHRSFLSEACPSLF